MSAWTALDHSHCVSWIGYGQVTGLAKTVGSKQWPEVYDLCHTFLHVALARKHTDMQEMHAFHMQEMHAKCMHFLHVRVWHTDMARNAREMRVAPGNWEAIDCLLFHLPGVLAWMYSSNNPNDLLRAVQEYLWSFMHFESLLNGYPIISLSTLGSTH